MSTYQLLGVCAKKGRERELKGHKDDEMRTKRLIRKGERESERYVNADEREIVKRKGKKSMKEG
jgi:hypothetical protein